MRKLAALVAVLLATAACGGDDSGGGGDSGGGDPEAFCDRLEELNEEEALDLDQEGAVAGLEELADIAPDEIEGDLTRIHGAFEALSELDQEDPDAFDEVLELLYDPALIESFDAFADYAEEECGVAVEGAEDLSGDVTDDFSADLT